MWRRDWKTISIIMVALVTSAMALVEYRRNYILNDRLACVATWLEKAKGLHTIEMKELGNFTGDTMRNLMDSVDGAYGCATMKPSHSRIAPGGGSFGQHGTMPPHK